MYYPFQKLFSRKENVLWALLLSLHVVGSMEDHIF